MDGRDLPEFSDVGMMKESRAAGRQDPCNLGEVRLDVVGVDVDERIKAEDKVHRVILGERQRAAVIDVVLDVGDVAETVAACGNALFRDVNDDETLAETREKRGPASEAGRNFENGMNRQMTFYSRKNGAVPLACAPPQAADHSLPPSDQS